MNEWDKFDPALGAPTPVLSADALGKELAEALDMIDSLQDNCRVLANSNLENEKFLRVSYTLLNKVLSEPRISDGLAREISSFLGEHGRDI